MTKEKEENLKEKNMKKKKKKSMRTQVNDVAFIYLFIA